MPIRRPRQPKPSLPHSAFLEAMGRGNPAHRRQAKATFLTLRLFDHWVALGADMAKSNARAFRAAASATAASAGDPVVREAMRFIQRGILMLREPDPQPFLRGLHELGQHFEGRGDLPEASDLYATVIRYADNSEHPLVADTHIRRGLCLRALGELRWAEQEYLRASTLSGTNKDRWRVLVARMGLAKVRLAAGDVRRADAAMREIAQQCELLVGDRRPAAGKRPGKKRAKARHKR